MTQTFEQKIAALDKNLLLGRGCLATDPIHLDYVLEGDPEANRQLLAITLAAKAQILRIAADTHEKAAKVVAAARAP